VRLGCIRCATIVSADADASAALYEDALEYQVLERGVIAAELALAWNAQEVAGARYVVLGPGRDADTLLRFIERRDAAVYPPYSCFGWNALELVVQNCDAAAARLGRRGFKMVGPPQDLDFSSGALRAAQMHGACGEVLYLTEIKRPLAGFDLPVAHRHIDRLFIAVLTGDTPQAGYDAYAQCFENAAGGIFQTAVPVIAQFQHLDAAHLFEVGTLQLAEQCYIEVDGAPYQVGVRPQQPGYLPPGIAMITLDTTAQPTQASRSESGFRPGGRLYGSNALLRTSGAFGEWLELLVQ